MGSSRLTVSAWLSPTSIPVCMVLVLLFLSHFSDAVAIEKVTVDDEFMDSDDSSIEQPLEKKAKGAPIPTSSMGGEIASSVNPFVCMAIGCPAINKDFKTKDNYGKHLK